MKLWYQSMSRQTEWGGYPRVLRGILDKVRDPDTEIHVAGITEIGGTGDQFRYLEYLETGEVLKNVHRAVREGFDAFLVGNIADPGLQEAREIADIPVLGLCESALHVACMMGASFSLVTINEKFTPRIVENVRRYGLRDRLAAVNRMQVDRLTDLGVGIRRCGGARSDRRAVHSCRAGQCRSGRRGGDCRGRRGDGAAGARRHPRRRRHADPERHHQPGEAWRDGGEDEPPDGRAVHLEALHLRAAAAGPDRRIPQALRGGYLSDGEVTMTQVVLRTALGKSPLVRALKQGTVRSDRVGFDFVEVDPVTRAFRRMTRALEFDLCEIALTTHAQARAYGKPITALPVVLLRGLHHGALICRRDSPLRGPADLVGRWVGVRAWSQTTGVWVRGILHDEYGIAPDSMTWVTEEDAHVQEFADPPFVQRIAAGQDLRAMLLSGEIDAAVALAGLEPAQVCTVLPDADAAAAAWSRKTGAYPINHVVVVKDALLAEHPWLAGELMRLFEASMQVADDTVPYGIAANRPAIELLMRYAAEQGLIPRAYKVEELFVT